MITCKIFGHKYQNFELSHEGYGVCAVRERKIICQKCGGLLMEINVEEKKNE
jgi:hypothetical protein